MIYSEVCIFAWVRYPDIKQSLKCISFLCQQMHCYFSGLDSRLSNSICRCCRLLSGLQRYRLRCQCGERTSLNASSGSDYLTKYFGYQEPTRDSKWSREYFRFHAECPWWSHHCLGHQSRACGNVRLILSSYVLNLRATVLVTKNCNKLLKKCDKYYDVFICFGIYNLAYFYIIICCEAQSSVNVMVRV